MRRIVGGREIDIPEDSNANADMQLVRDVIDLDPSEVLIEQVPTGENFILPKKGSVKLHPSSQLMIAPLIERGG